jgi:phosphoglucomutase
MMEKFRKDPPKILNGIAVTELLDYEKREARNLLTNTVSPILLPKSNVLQFVLEDGSKISARPSGTEPKIKFYFSVKGKLDSKEKADAVQAALDLKIQKIIADLKL